MGSFQCQLWRGLIGSCNCIKNGVQSGQAWRGIAAQPRGHLQEDAVSNVIPPKVDYRLTVPGRTFAEPIEQMYQWGLENQAALDEMEQNLQSGAQ